MNEDEFFDFVFLELLLIIICVVFWLCVCIVAVHYSVVAQTSRSFDLLLLSFPEDIDMYLNLNRYLYQGFTSISIFISTSNSVFIYRDVSVK